jgi:hypothetical protein
VWLFGLVEMGRFWFSTIDASMVSVPFLNSVIKRQEFSINIKFFDEQEGATGPV